LKSHTNLKIGIFDSGLGGVSIAKKLLELPGLEIYYYADNKNLPYGNKTPSEIINFSSQVVEYFITYEIDIIIIACHTISVIAAHNLRALFPSLLFIDMLELTLLPTIKSTQNNSIGIIATQASINSNQHIYHLQKYNPALHIYPQACPELASVIENNYLSGKKELSLDAYLKNLEKKNIDTLLLGCTHYELIKNEINIYFRGKVNLIGADSSIQDYFLKRISKNLNSNQSSIRFYCSAPSKKFYRTCNKMLTL